MKGKKRKCAWMVERNKKYKTFKPKVKITCAYCKKEFEVIPGRALTAKYCSKECKNKDLITTGISLYREFALNTLPNICYLCYSKKNLCVHHIDGDRTNNRLGNLIIVCKSCHFKIHQREK